MWSQFKGERLTSFSVGPADCRSGKDENVTYRMQQCRPDAGPFANLKAAAFRQ